MQSPLALYQSIATVQFAYLNSDPGTFFPTLLSGLRSMPYPFSAILVLVSGDNFTNAGQAFS